MAGLNLTGPLDLGGMLNLTGGKITVGKLEVLVPSTPPGDPEHGTGAPVPLPPPAPIDVGAKVWVLSSFNATVTANGKPIVAQGMCIQGNTPTWPGMVQPSTNNVAPVTINHIAINVVGDLATILPTGAPAPLSKSGQ